MEVKVSYSKVQLKLAVDYIAKYNVYFLNEHEEIEKTILEYIKILVSDPEEFSIGTMGFTLFADREFEDLDNDENCCRIDILIDPAVGVKHIDDDYHTETINV